MDQTYVHIKNAFFDIDGVLTDGAVYIQENGTETKRITFDDIDAIFELKRAGVRIGFITGENNHFSDYVQRRFEPDFFISGCKDKLRGFQELAAQENLEFQNTCFVGDSQKDIELLSFLHYYSFVPNDVNENVKKAACYIVPASRGNGVIRKVVEFIQHINHEQNGKGEIGHFYLEMIADHQKVVDSLRKDIFLLKELELAVSIISNALKSGGRLFICGHGGSAVEFLQTAERMVETLQLQNKVLFIEALTLKIPFLKNINHVLSKCIEKEGRAGDVIIGLATTDIAEQVVQALAYAKEKEMQTIKLTGKYKDTTTHSGNDVCICVPSSSQPRVNECINLIGHIICEVIKNKINLED